MDRNKEKVMKMVCYKIRETCENCIFGKFNSKDWGECTQQEYMHLKHNRIHFMTIYKSGYCKNFNWKSVDFGSYDQFKE